MGKSYIYIIFHSYVTVSLLEGNHKVAPLLPELVALGHLIEFRRSINLQGHTRFPVWHMLRMLRCLATSANLTGRAILVRWSRLSLGLYPLVEVHTTSCSLYFLNKCDRCVLLYFRMILVGYSAIPSLGIPGGGTGDSTGFGVALSQESFAKKFKPITSVAPKTSGSWRDTGPVLIWSSKKKEEPLKQQLNH